MQKHNTKFDLNTSSFKYSTVNMKWNTYVDRFFAEEAAIFSRSPTTAKSIHVVPAWPAAMATSCCDMQISWNEVARTSSSRTMVPPYSCLKSLTWSWHGIQRILYWMLQYDKPLNLAPVLLSYCSCLLLPLSLSLLLPPLPLPTLTLPIPLNLFYRFPCPGRNVLGW